MTAPDGLDPLRAAALPADAPGAWIRAAIDARRGGLPDDWSEAAGVPLDDAGPGDRPGGDG